MEVYTDFATQSTDSVNRRNKRMGASRGRSEKNAIRVCGDWSEQLSSKGKIYFYNCITEVSQWQKPPEWKLPDMNPDELLRLLAHRDGHAEGKNLKRSRPSLSSGYMSCDGDGRHFSPKRTKVLADCTEKTIKRDDEGGSFVRKSGSSQKRDLRSSQNYSDLQMKVSLSSVTSRTYLTDDMEISPNSSPLSNSSSPSNVNLSPCFSRPSRMNHLRHDTQSRPLAQPEESSPGTLRQLVDAIRASIGGLLECPTRCSESSIPPSFSGHIRSGPQYTTELRFRDTVAHAPSRSQFGNDQFNGGPTSAILVESPHVDKRTHPADPLIASSNLVAGEKCRTTQTQAIPGLVSTLTTLVSLIGNTKPSVPTTHCSPRSSGIRVPLQASHHTSPLVRLPSSSADVDDHRDIPNESPNAHSRATYDGGLHPSGNMRSAFNSPLVNSEHRASTTHGDNQNMSKTSRIILTCGPSHVGLLPSDSSPSYANRRRKSDVSEIPNRLNALRSANLSEASCVRNSSGSFDGSDHSLHETGRCRPPYPCPKRLNGVCKSPSCTELDNPNSPILRLSAAESSWSPSRPHPIPSTSIPVGTRDGCLSNESMLADEMVSTPILTSPETLSYVVDSMSTKFMDKTAERIEKEVHHEAKVFEKFQSVLYGELSTESKKLRALIRISDAKLAIHREKQTSLQELIDAIETRRCLRNMSFSDDAP